MPNDFVDDINQSRDPDEGFYTGFASYVTPEPETMRQNAQIASHSVREQVGSLFMTMGRIATDAELIHDRRVEAFKKILKETDPSQLNLIVDSISADIKRAADTARALHGSVEWSERSQLVHHERNDIACRHFIDAKTSNQRQEAIKVLRDEVRSDNLSALPLLRTMICMDALLRLAESIKKSDLPGAKPEERKEQAARCLNDLALMEQADLRLNRPASMAGKLLERLAEDAGQLRAAARQEIDQREVHIGQTMGALVRGTSPEAAVKKLQQALNNEISDTGSDRLKAVLQFAEGASLLRRLVSELDYPERTAKRLEQLKQLSDRGNRLAEQALNELCKSPEGKQLFISIGKPELLKLLDSKAVNMLAAAINIPSATVANLRDLRSEDILKVIATPEHLQEARKAAENFLAKSFEKADRAMLAFMDRGANVQTRQRELENLQAASDDRLRSLGRDDFGSLLRKFEFVHQAKIFQEAINDARRIFHDDTRMPEEKTNAFRNIEMQWEKLSKIFKDNPEAHSVLKTLAPKTLNTLTGEVTEILNLQNPHHRMAAWSSLQNSLSAGEEVLNPLRSMRAVRDLNNKSTSDQFQQAIDLLKHEADDCGNDSAREWLKWAEACKHVAEIEESAKSNASDRALKAVQALAKEAATNDYAKSTLAGLLAHASGSRGLRCWVQQETKIHQDKVVITVSLDGLSNKTDLLIQATKGLCDGAMARRITKADATAIALLLGKDEQGNPELGKQLGRALDLADGKSTLTGLFEAIALADFNKARLADYYLRRIDDPSAASHFESFKAWAQRGDVNSVYILAGLTAGMGDKNAALHKQGIVSRAAAALREIALQSPTEAIVQDALVYTFNQGAERNQLLPTLGAIVDRVSIPRPGVLEALRAGLRTDPQNDSEGYKNAVDGFLKAARQWGKEEKDDLVNYLTVELAQGLARVADKIKPAVREALLVEMHNLFKMQKTPAHDGWNILQIDEADKKVRRAAVMIIGALGKFATTEQVQDLAEYGGPPGLVRLIERGFSAEHARNLQTDVARTLLRVIALAPGCDHREQPTKGPRELAYDAFKTHAWPGLESSKLRHALLNYAEGRPWDQTLKEEITKIAYDVDVPRPTIIILESWGVTANNETAMRDKTAVVLTSYSDQAIRRVDRNIVLYNSLPPHIRREISGRTEAVSPTKVFSQLYLNNLQHGSNEFLLDDLSKKLAAIERKNADHVWEVGKRLQAYERTLKDEVESLANFTEKGRPILKHLGQSVEMYSSHRLGMELIESVASSTAKSTAEFLYDSRPAPHPLTDIVSGLTEFVGLQVDKYQQLQDSVAQWPERQRSGVELISELESKIRKLKAYQGLAEVERQSMEQAAQAAKYTEIRNSGKQRDADLLLLDMWQQHGSTLLPDLQRELIDSDNTRVGRGALSRLRDAGAVQFGAVPNFAEGKNGLTKALDRIQELSFTFPHRDSAAQLGAALSRIDSTVADLQQKALVIQANMESWSRLVEAAQTGTKLQPMVDFLYAKSQVLKSVLNFDEKQRLQLRDCITQMEGAVKAMKENNDEHRKDPAIMALEQRIANFKNMHDLMSDQDDKYNPADRTRATLKELIAKVESRDFSEDGLGKWLRENIVVLGATIAAVSLVVGTLVTCGISSPLLIGAAATLTGIAAAETTREGLYLFNHYVFDTGLGKYDERSLVGEFRQRCGKDPGYRTWQNFWENVGSKYFQQAIQDIGLWVCSMGLGKLLTAGMQGKPSSLLKSMAFGDGKTIQQIAFKNRLLVLEAQKKGVLGEFAKEWVTNIWGNIKWNGTLQTGVQTGLAAGSELLDIPGTNRWLNIGVNVIVALSHTRATVQTIRGNNRVEGLKITANNPTEVNIILHKLRLQGMEVTRTGTGRYTLGDPSCKSTGKLPTLEVQVDPRVVPNDAGIQHKSSGANPTGTADGAELTSEFSWNPNRGRLIQQPKGVFLGFTKTAELQQWIGQLREQPGSL